MEGSIVDKLETNLALHHGRILKHFTPKATLFSHKMIHNSTLTGKKTMFSNLTPNLGDQAQTQVLSSHQTNRTTDVVVDHVQTQKIGVASQERAANKIIAGVLHKTRVGQHGDDMVAMIDFLLLLDRHDAKLWELNNIRQEILDSKVAWSFCTEDVALVRDEWAREGIFFSEKEL
jgi:hypothetical protein